MKRAFYIYAGLSLLVALVGLARVEIRSRNVEAAIQASREAAEALRAIPACQRRTFETDRDYARCRYERAVERVAVTAEAPERPGYLAEAALAALDAGRPAAARAYVRAARGALADTQDDDLSYPGETVEKTAVVDGRLALAAGDTATARRRLIEAARSLTEPTQLSFGPNVTLARDLLVAGDTVAVRAYFDVLDATWPAGGDELGEWRTALDRSEGPDFGANLIY